MVIRVFFPHHFGLILLFAPLGFVSCQIRFVFCTVMYSVRAFILQTENMIILINCVVAVEFFSGAIIINYWADDQVGPAWSLIASENDFSHEKVQCGEGEGGGIL